MLHDTKKILSDINELNKFLLDNKKTLSSKELIPEEFFKPMVSFLEKLKETQNNISKLDKENKKEFENKFNDIFNKVDKIDSMHSIVERTHKMKENDLAKKIHSISKEIYTKHYTEQNTENKLPKAVVDFSGQGGLFTKGK
jgi:hypothetical protein